jgi:multisubunit Na+/H+ antiporter MnhC subunit
MLTRIGGRVRKPVRRSRAQRYLLITLLSFAVSVAGTRLFLELTGYPQLGGGELHVAHVLWGGLLLFAASLLMMILANRWVYILGAVLAGLGVGLFIDEVGKFITQTNDYFYPAAAPIVYALFLLTVVIYLQIRRPPAYDARAELYRALGGMTELLDNHLEPSEFNALENSLQQVISKAQDDDQARLAQHLLDYLRSDSVQVIPDQQNFIERVIHTVLAWELRWLNLRRYRAILVGGLAAIGVNTFLHLTRLLLAARTPGGLEQIFQKLLTAGQVSTTTGMLGFVIRAGLEGSVGLILILAAAFILIGRERRGLNLGVLIYWSFITSSFQRSSQLRSNLHFLW